LNPTDACQGQTYLTTEKWLSTTVGGEVGEVGETGETGEVDQGGDDALTLRLHP
jgi:hypothetical protein